MIAFCSGFYAFTDDEVQEKINLIKEKHRDYNITSLRVEETDLFFYTVVMYMTEKEEINIDQCNFPGGSRGVILVYMRGGTFYSANRCGKVSSISFKGVY